MRNKFPVLIFVLMTTNFVYSQNLLHFSIGQPMQFPDARSLSMGGAGSVSLSAPGAILYNPAALTQINRTLVMDVSLFSRKFEDRRSYPLYDRFDGFLVNSTYAINNNWYHNPQGAVAYRLPITFLTNSTIALGTYTEVDQNYTYLEEVRENIFGDPIIAYNRLEINGKLQRYAIAFAFSMPKIQGLSIGVQTSLLKGSLRSEMNVNYVETSEKVVIYDLDGKLDNSPQRIVSAMTAF